MMLPWTCQHCGSRHETDAQEHRCKREQRRLTWITASILVSIGFIVLTIALVWNQYMYDDWRCAFAHCVKVTR